MRLTVLGGLCAIACTIPAARAAVRQSAVVVAARASLIAQLHHIRPDISRIDATVMGHPASPMVAGARWVVPSHALCGHALAAHMCVWIERRSAGGRAIASVPVWFSVHAYRPVLVSATHHWARDGVGARDFTVEMRDVAGLGAIPVDVQASFTGMRARRALIAGRILMRSDIEPIPEVLRGDEVTVEVTDGPVAIQTQAVALREARLGQTIELRNPTSRKTYTAQVVGRGRAAVEVSQ